MSEATFEDWRALVEKALKGAPLESLTTTTLDGLRIAPLYTERDRPPAEGIPWAPRATRALGPMVFDLAGDLGALRRAGASAVLVTLVDGPIEPPDGLEVLVHAPCDRGASLAREGVRSIFDPWFTMRAADPSVGARSIDAVVRAVERGAPALAANGALWRFAGAGTDETLGLTIASLVESLRALEARGIDLERAIGLTTIHVDADTDFFVEIARVRALRRLVDRVLRSAGIAARPVVSAETAHRSLSHLAAPTNAIRATIAAAAALIGGADIVCVHPHAWRGDGVSRASRVALTTPLVLALESHLGATADAAAGSPFVEAVTRELAARAWGLFQAIEAAGGVARQPAVIFERLAATRARERAAISTRKRPLVGVSRFPVEEPVAFAGSLMASPYERLRIRGSTLAAHVVVVPGCPEARVEFAREVAQLASGRVEVVRGPSAPGAPLAVVCASDADLGGAAVDAARTAKQHGARAVAIAGKPGAHENALREAGVDAFVYVGVDTVAALEVLLDRVEGKGAS